MTDTRRPSGYARAGMRKIWLTVAVVLTMAGCGGNAEETVDTGKAARSALRAVEPDLERLARAVRDVDVDDKASLVDIQAAAQRASQTLGDARSDLRDLAEGDGVADGDVRRLRVQANAVADLRELADVLAQPKLSSPRIEAAFARVRLAQEDLSADLDVPAINADVLSADLRKARQESAEVRSRQAATRRRKRDNAAQTGQPSRPIGSGGGGASTFGYFSYVGPAFQARVPTGAGWGSPSASEPNPGRLFRTNIRGPGGLFLLIDYTPGEAARFGAGGTVYSRSVVGQTAFGAAVRYEFQGGRIAECQRARCIDYIINDGLNGAGFAVLAGGGPQAAEIARVVAESVVPGGD